MRKKLRLHSFFVPQTQIPGHVPVKKSQSRDGQVTAEMRFQLILLSTKTEIIAWVAFFRIGEYEYNFHEKYVSHMMKAGSVQDICRRKYCDVFGISKIVAR